MLTRANHDIVKNYDGHAGDRRLRSRNGNRHDHRRRELVAIIASGLNERIDDTNANLNARAGDVNARIGDVYAGSRARTSGSTTRTSGSTTRTSGSTTRNERIDDTNERIDEVLAEIRDLRALVIDAIGRNETCRQLTASNAPTTAVAFAAARIGRGAVPRAAKMPSIRRCSMRHVIAILAAIALLPLVANAQTARAHPVGRPRPAGRVGPTGPRHRSSGRASSRGGPGSPPKSARSSMRRPRPPATARRPPGPTGAYNSFWLDRGLRNDQTSLIVYPSDGRYPARTERVRESDPAFRRRATARCSTRGRT